MLPLPDKVKAIKNIAVPTIKKHLRSSIRLIQYYRDIWKHRSGILIPLSSMTTNQANGIGVKNIRRHLIQFES